MAAHRAQTAEQGLATKRKAVKREASHKNEGSKNTLLPRQGAAH